MCPSFSPVGETSKFQISHKKFYSRHRIFSKTSKVYLIIWEIAINFRPPRIWHFCSRISASVLISTYLICISVEIMTCIKSSLLSSACSAVFFVAKPFPSPGTCRQPGFWWLYLPVLSFRAFSLLVSTWHSSHSGFGKCVSMRARLLVFVSWHTPFETQQRCSCSFIFSHQNNMNEVLILLGKSSLSMKSVYLFNMAFHEDLFLLGMISRNEVIQPSYFDISLLLAFTFKPTYL